MAAVDYKKLPGSVTIPAGAAKAKIKVKTHRRFAQRRTRSRSKFDCCPVRTASYVVGAGVVNIKLVGK